MRLTTLSSRFSDDSRRSHLDSGCQNQRNRDEERTERGLGTLRSDNPAHRSRLQRAGRSLDMKQHLVPAHIPNSD